MSGKFAEFIEAEVLPAVETHAGVTLSREGKDRAVMGCSSGAAAAFTMAWNHPEWYRRVISYSGTFVNQQWPFNPATPGGAWEYHNGVIANAPVKPIRIWMHVGDRDLYNPNLDARRHARLGGGQPSNGSDSQSEGLPLPVTYSHSTHRTAIAACESKPCRPRSNSSGSRREGWPASRRSLTRMSRPPSRGALYSPGITASRDARWKTWAKP